MGFFGSSKKHVSKTEFRDVRSRMYGKNFSRDEIEKIQMIFRSDLDEPEELQRGIDQGELERGIAWMRAHERIHRISSQKIDLLEEMLKEKL